MAGHSKWANIKHKKAKVDAQKGKIFTKIGREIMVAVKEGGADPEANFRLKMVIQKAKENNMPGDNINRAIQKAAGGGDGSSYEEITYEGYGPGGVAVMLNILTDNRNRTAGDIRHLFSKYGGNLGETGCVNWMFDKKGLIVIENEDGEIDEDELMLAVLDSGAEDIKGEDNYIEIITPPEQLQSVTDTLKENGYVFSTAEVTMLPQNTTSLNQEDGEKMMKLIDALEDHDDVQDVYHNWDIPEEMME
jgi:YebC/PmpR family DNA-binding regulatory protein